MFLKIYAMITQSVKIRHLLYCIWFMKKCFDFESIEVYHLFSKSSVKYILLQITK